MTLKPEFHFLEVAYPYVARRLLTDEDPALRERLFQVGHGETAKPAKWLNRKHLWACGRGGKRGRRVGRCLLRPTTGPVPGWPVPWRDGWGGQGRTTALRSYLRKLTMLQNALAMRVTPAGPVPGRPVPVEAA